MPESNATSYAAGALPRYTAARTIRHRFDQDNRDAVTAQLRTDLEAMAAADGNVLVGDITLEVHDTGGRSDTAAVSATGYGSPAGEPAPKPGWRPKVLVDFDGVIHRYSKGWADGTTYDPPIPGAKEALAAIEADGYEVVIFSTREAAQIKAWLLVWRFPIYRVTNVKEPAVAQIDDRAIRFTDWPQAVHDLQQFYPVRRG